MKSISAFILFGAMLIAPVAQAQIQHVEMRVEGMT